MPRRVRGTKNANYYYTHGQEWRTWDDGEEYIGPYFELKGKYGSGDNAKSPDVVSLLPYSMAKEVIIYRNRFEDFNDFLTYPKQFYPVVLKTLDKISRVFVYDELTGRFFEIDPKMSKYYSSNKPLRNRFLVDNVNYILKGAGAIMKNIDAISKTSFPGHIKELYLDPTDFVEDSGIITYIDSRPLFQSLEQALVYGEYQGLEGYTTHIVGGVTGYLPGSIHGHNTDDSGDLVDEGYS